MPTATGSYPKMDRFDRPDPANAKHVDSRVGCALIPPSRSPRRFHARKAPVPSPPPLAPPVSRQDDSFNSIQLDPGQYVEYECIYL